MTRYSTVIIFILFIPLTLFAREPVSVTGTVVDENGNPVEIVTVSIAGREDSTALFGCLTDRSGHYKVVVTPADQYLIFTHIAYETLELKEFSVDDTVVLQSKVSDIESVVVKGNYIRNKPGGYVVSVKDNPLAVGRSAQDFLGLMPGIINNNGLTILGNEVSEILINGRKVKDREELKALTAANVESIEVDYKAGSEYDADKQGGIIHITLRRNDKGSYYGSLSNSIDIRPSSGDFWENVNGIINYNLGKLDIYNYTAFNYNNINSTSVTKTHYLNDDQRINTRSQTKGHGRTVSDNLSMVYEINKNNNIGLNLFIYNRTVQNDPYTSNSTLQDADGNLTGKSGSKRKGGNYWERYQGSLNYNLKIGSKGSDMRFIADYMRQANGYDRSTHNFYDYYTSQPTSSFREKSHQLNHIFESELRFRNKFNFPGTLSYGAKYQYRNNEERIIFLSQTGEEFENVNVQRNRYSGYVSFDSEVGRFYYRLGGRFQSDQIKIKEEGVKTVDKNYPKFYPQLRAGFFLDQEKSSNIEVEYSNYLGYLPIAELSPVLRYQDEFSYSIGNPNLKPQTAYIISFKLTIIKDWTLIYTFRKDKNEIWTTIIPIEDGLYKYFETSVNAGYNNSHLVDFIFKQNIFSWWLVSGNLSAYHHRNHVKLNDLRETRIATRWRAYINTFFTLPKSWRTGFSFYGETKEKHGDEVWDGVYYLDLDLTKTLLDNKLTINLNGSILSKYRKRTKLTSTLEQRYYTVFPHMYTLKVSYNFNKGKRTNVKRTARLIDPDN